MRVTKEVKQVTTVRFEINTDQLMCLQEDGCFVTTLPRSENVPIGH